MRQNNDPHLTNHSPYQRDGLAARHPEPRKARGDPRYSLRVLAPRELDLAVPRAHRDCVRKSRDGALKRLAQRRALDSARVLHGHTQTFSRHLCSDLAPAAATGVVVRGARSCNRTRKPVGIIVGLSRSCTALTVGDPRRDRPTDMTGFTGTGKRTKCHQEPKFGHMGNGC